MKPYFSSRRSSLLVFLLLPAILLVACSDTEDEPPLTATAAGAIATATVAPEVSPTSRPAGSAAIATVPSSSPTPAPGNGEVLEYEGYEIVGEFAYADAVDFPEDLMLIVETGCSHCDGPTEALYRVWRNSGEAHVELLVDVAISGSENAYITSFALRPDLSDIVVTICTVCGNGAPFTESPVTLYRSLDGGLTWRDIFTAPAGQPIFARAITPEGIVVADLDEGLSYLRGSAIEPPPGADRLLPDSNRAGGLRWLADDGSTVLDAGGLPIAFVEPGSLIDAVALDGLDAARAVTGWAIGYVGGPFEGWTATKVGPDGRLVGFRSDDYLAPVSVLKNGDVMGILSGDSGLEGGVIGYIDVTKGVLTPIAGPLVEAPFGSDGAAIGRNRLLAALAGPFLRVTTGVNCLPIRETTEVQSREITCAADGTLVYDLSNSTTVGGQQWTRVRLLDGREGYAVASFLTSE